MRRILLSIFGIMFVTTVLGGGLGVLLVMNHYSADLPDFRELGNYEPPVATRFYARDGRLLADYAEERRLFVPIEAVPRHVVNAFLAAEDKSFYQHPGIDFAAVVRAILQNIGNVSSGRRLVGASTITQQVAKNFLLDSKVSFERKIREVILAFRIERAFTKNQILELYFNEIFLGLNSYGVAAAALNYFNKPISKLSVAEAAYMGALPKGPNNYHPERQTAAAIGRRNWVIDRMVTEGHLTTPEAEKAKEEPLRQLQRYADSEQAEGGFFAEAVRRQLVNTYGRDRVYRGGLVVRTTLDTRMQRLAEQSLRKGLIDYDRRHGWRGPVTRFIKLAHWITQLQNLNGPRLVDGWTYAVVLEVGRKSAKLGFEAGHSGRLPMSGMKWARPWGKGQVVGPRPRKATDVLRKGDVIVVSAMEGKRGQYKLEQIPNVQGALIALDVHTGRVLAMQGGFDFSQQGNSFNRSTQAWRQPGSAFKPFVYMAALEKGYAPNTIILDAPFVLCQQTNKPCWRPENYSSTFYGPTPMRVGVERSRNLMTIRLAQSIGMRSVREIARRFRVVDDMPLFLPLALGAGETTVIRLTAAYGMIANGGKRIDPTLIDRIQDRHGRTIFRHDRRPCPGCRVDRWSHQAPPVLDDVREQIVKPGTAYQMVSMLEGVVKRGTGRSIASLARPVAGKTGTTNESFDTWFIGFTPDLVVGVFVGFDQPGTLGARETGSSVAAPIFKSFMQATLSDVQPRPFPVPGGVRLVPVDRNAGVKCTLGDSGCILEAFTPGSEPGDQDLARGGYASTVIIEGDLSQAEAERAHWPSLPRSGQTQGFPVAGPGSATGGLAPPPVGTPGVQGFTPYPTRLPATVAGQQPAPFAGQQPAPFAGQPQRQPGTWQPTRPGVAGSPPPFTGQRQLDRSAFPPLPVPGGGAVRQQQQQSRVPTGAVPGQGTGGIY